MIRSIFTSTLEYVQRWVGEVIAWSIANPWKVLSTVAATMSGIIFFCYEWRPQLSIAPTDPLDRRDPWSFSFLATNTGKLTLRSLEWVCVLNDVRYAGNINVVGSLTSDQPTYGKADFLESNKAATVKLLVNRNIRIVRPVEAARIDLCFRFRLPFHPIAKLVWRTTDFSRFYLEKDTEGNYLWRTAGQSDTVDCHTQFRKKETVLRESEELHRQLEQRRREMQRRMFRRD